MRRSSISSDDTVSAAPSIDGATARFVDAIPEIVWACADNGQLTYVNRAWTSFTGIGREAAIEAGWLGALHPEDVQRHARRLGQHVASGEPFEFEFRLRRFDGSYRWMRSRGAPIGTAQAAGAAWTGTCIDIDDQRGTSGENSIIRVLDSRLRRLFDASVMGIVISNNAGAILECNDAFLTLIGFTRDEFEAGRVDWRAITPAHWLPLDERAIRQMAERGVFSPYEKEYIRRDGTRVPVSLGGARIEGTLDEQICYIVDLTEIRRAEAALRRSEARFGRLADAGVIGIISTRASDHVVVAANDEWLRIVAYDRDDLNAGRIRWTAITPPDWLAAGERAMRDLRATGRFAPYEKEYVRKDGSRIPVLIGGALLEEADEIVCCVLDLTEQKAATQQLQQSERRYRILAEALPQIIMLSESDRRPVYVNRHYEEYTGIKIGDVPEKWSQVIHPDDLPAIERARATGEPYEVEYRLRRASDETYRWHFARVLKIPSEAHDQAWLAAALDIDDRKRAEDTLRFIEKAGRLLGQSLDSETTFATLLELVVPDYGDYATIAMRDEDGTSTTIVGRHRDPAKAPILRKLCGTDYLLESAGFGSAEVYRTGLPQIVARMSRDDLAAAIKPEYLALFDELGFGSLVALPFFSGDDVVGTLTIVSADERRTYTAADLPALEELTRRAGFAIRNARRYEREHRVANLLQEAALPRVLPVVRGLRFDGYYRAGRQEAAIGGDWFDALVVADGRVVISVGDVAGSGLLAAVLMGNVRQVIRGAAHVYADPMMMFEIADRTLRSEHDNSVVTAFVAVIDPVRRTMQYASAGHLPALLRGADGQIEALTAPGLPLGCRDMGTCESRTAILPPGSALLLYTDGLVEWSRDLIAGEAVLLGRFAQLDITAEHPAKALVDSVLPPTGARDDIAALTVCVDALAG